MNEMIDLIEKEHMRLDLIDVNVGDSVKVYTKIGSRCLRASSSGRGAETRGPRLR